MADRHRCVFADQKHRKGLSNSKAAPHDRHLPARCIDAIEVEKLHNRLRRAGRITFPLPAYTFAMLTMPCSQYPFSGAISTFSFPSDRCRATDEIREFRERIHQVQGLTVSSSEFWDTSPEAQSLRFGACLRNRLYPLL
jgi:hypothetical protein